MRQLLKRFKKIGQKAPPLAENSGSDHVAGALQSAVEQRMHAIPSCTLSGWPANNTSSLQAVAERQSLEACILDVERRKMMTQRGPWNRGRKVGQRLPLSGAQKAIIRHALQSIAPSLQRSRDLALFDVAVDSCLSGSDLVCMNVSDVANEHSVETIAQIVNPRTGLTQSFMLRPETQLTLHSWIEASDKKQSDFLWTGLTRKQSAHLSPGQYRRLFRRWLMQAGIHSTSYSAHSLRCREEGQA